MINSKKQKFDIMLFIAVIVLILFGLIMIYSSSSVWAEYKFNDSFKYVKQQSLFIVIGIILMITISKIDYSWYYKKTNIILAVCLFLLVLVLIPGIGTVRNGSQSWFGIGSFGIQPSEFSKLGLIIFTAKYLSNNNKVLKTNGGRVLGATEVANSLKSAIDGAYQLVKDISFDNAYYRNDIGAKALKAVTEVK